MNRISLCLIYSIIAFSTLSHGHDTSLVSGSRYFGETPPGLTPKRFSPKVLDHDGLLEAGFYSPDMTEFYFVKRNGKTNQRWFFVIRYEQNRWGEATETDIKWPLFSADGNRIYSEKAYRDRTSTGWSAPKSLGAFIKEQAHGRSVSDNGTFYFPFFKKEDKGRGNLGYARLINGKYENPIKLGPEINKGDYIAHPFVAPDESYLMWDVEREDNQGGHKPDIYISFKQRNGTWGPAINMGSKINTPVYEQSPVVTPDGKYLFFWRGEERVKEDGSIYWVGNPYWVDAKVIEDLRNKSY
ncbi:hypothetical protein ACSLBF_10050 [Pseudoalteromonas sp. T1lg65]|uniref:hypothetical protein n=1 Tax=Pseudoalteromonas sp. T1lg65 TaxID=2077101 RepID=UPI003F796358